MWRLRKGSSEFRGHSITKRQCSTSISSHEPKKSGYWKDFKNHREFFDILGKELEFKNLDDWYNITTEQIQNAGGHTLLAEYYYNSPSTALKKIYPEHNWIPWKFNRAPSGLWKESENHLLFFDWLGEKLGLKQLND